MKYAIATSTSGGTLDAKAIGKFARRAVALQFYSDGGLVRDMGGAYGIQLIGHIGDEEKPERVQVGYLFNFDPGATSAFDVELRGLGTAVEILLKACEIVE